MVATKDKTVEKNIIKLRGYFLTSSLSHPTISVSSSNQQSQPTKNISTFFKTVTHTVLFLTINLNQSKTSQLYL